MDQSTSDFLPFPSARAKYAIFNFHRKEQCTRVTAWLGRDSKRSILLLSGPARIGKTYVVETAAWQLRDTIQIGAVDLRGYEPRTGSLIDYLQHGIRIAQDLTPSTRGGNTASLSFDIKAPSIFTVAGVSLGLSLKIPLETIKTFFAATVDLPGPPVDDKTNLALFLASLTRKQKLAIVLKQAELATDALLSWLVFQCNVNPGLYNLDYWVTSGS